MKNFKKIALLLSVLALLTAVLAIGTADAIYTDGYAVCFQG